MLAEGLLVSSSRGGRLRTDDFRTHPGKRPLLAWEPFQTRIASSIEVRDWWATWPSANVGVVCGRVSGLLAIDIDGEPGEDLLLVLSAGEEIPPTLRFATA